MTYDVSLFNQNLLAALKSKIDAASDVSIDRDELTWEVPVADFYESMTLLRDDPSLSFDILADVCGVDYLGYGASEWQVEKSTSGFSRGVVSDGLSAQSQDGMNSDKPRFAAVYHLLSTTYNWRLRVKSYLVDDDFPSIPSVVDLWPSANWFEREAFDLFGIRFEGHPDLRRILTDYGFQGHPFRKDFPLSGHVEMVYDDSQSRVVYQPVDVQERVLVPRVIRQRGHKKATSEVASADNASE